MQKSHSGILYSASDLVNFLECEHLTALDLIDLVTPLPRTLDSDEAKLIQERGHQHEARFLAELKSNTDSWIDVAANAKTLAQKCELTLASMRQGVHIIYQASLKDGNLVGHADFLRRIEVPSDLGAYSYEVLDTKLARSPKAKFLVQLGFYSSLVAKAQGQMPQFMYVVLGDQSVATYRCQDYAYYLDHVLDKFLQHVAAPSQAHQTYPNPCEKCAQCKWSGLCDARRIADDHLSAVAGITKIQIHKLADAGITTLKGLAALDPSARISRISDGTLDKIRTQAALQFKARETGQNYVELIDPQPEPDKGFGRMPPPANGDLFFDMEGNPLEEGGLEYLFGLYYFESGKPLFKAFWAHSRAEERLAFEAFMDFVSGWLHKHPGAHIYHYANYEQAALKKLMCLHGTREALVDDWLKRGLMIDLYKVVREAIRVSEPSYSIKNLEHFYLDGRTVDVKSAGASIVYYERWKETGDPQVLKDIEDYNFDDVRSTYELRQWLLKLQPPGTPQQDTPTPQDMAAIADNDEAVTPTARMQAEERLLAYRHKLVEGSPVDRALWTAQHHLKELTFQLLDFHHRSAKPAWWAYFERQDQTDWELLEDAECLAMLTPDPANPPLPDKRSLVHTYVIPEQDYKLKSGDTVTVVRTGEQINSVLVDHQANRITFRRTANKEPLPYPLSLGAGGPIKTAVLTEAIYRFADALLAGHGQYAALESFLHRDLPRIKGMQPGPPIIDAALTEPAQVTKAIVDAISKLNKSYLFVQGPPGAGKTYTGSHVIAALVRQGFKVGVTSNSHKAIDNLLQAVDAEAAKQRIALKGVKKVSAIANRQSSGFSLITEATRNEDVAYALSGGCNLAAGTAWLFADEDLNQTLDFLFIDEAGQVSLANPIAVGTSARNIVLLGDQMQLSQPIQGVHPGRSGDSSLDYMLDGQATIAPERGIFLATTWRMHPDVCRFISEAVYDGRLVSEKSTFAQRLVLSGSFHAAIRPTGVSYLPVAHEGCKQSSAAEAALVAELVRDLMAQSYLDGKGVQHSMALDDILVVTPYNMQVALLSQHLPEGARIGTVDKFQGQEGQVVIVSMATSSGDDLPRNIEFLYSKNRLNVAISRAKCLAIFIANPALMSIQCSTPEQMALVNTLCHIAAFSKSQSQR